MIYTTKRRFKIREPKVGRDWVDYLDQIWSYSLPKSFFENLFNKEDSILYAYTVDLGRLEDQNYDQTPDIMQINPS